MDGIKTHVAVRHLRIIETHQILSPAREQVGIARDLVGILKTVRCHRDLTLPDVIHFVIK